MSITLPQIPNSINTKGVTPTPNVSNLPPPPNLVPQPEGPTHYSVNLQLPIPMFDEFRKLAENIPYINKDLGMAFIQSLNWWMDTQKRLNNGEKVCFLSPEGEAAYPNLDPTVSSEQFQKNIEEFFVKFNLAKENNSQS